MIRSRVLLCTVAALMLATTNGAQAQGFFERLFGLVPSRPQPPPQAQPAPAPLPEAGPPPAEAPRRAPSSPVSAKPVAVKAPSEDSVIGRDLKQNGANGSLHIERGPNADLRMKMTLLGRKSPQSVETCSVSLGGQDGFALVSLGRPEGAPRYEIKDAACPMQLDVLDEAVLIKGPADVCVFESAGCQADPSGVWGPDPSQLLPRAQEFEQQRASADKVVRENFKALVQRNKSEVRAIVAEQAAFSADRETMCHAYAREATTNFCNAKFTEARALSLATRLGVTAAAASTASVDPRPPHIREVDPYSLPPTDELMQAPPQSRDDDDSE